MTVNLNTSIAKSCLVFSCEQSKLLPWVWDPFYSKHISTCLLYPIPGILQTRSIKLWDLTRIDWKSEWTGKQLKWQTVWGIFNFRSREMHPANLKTDCLKSFLNPVLKESHSTSGSLNYSWSALSVALSQTLLTEERTAWHKTLTTFSWISKRRFFSCWKQNWNHQCQILITLKM